MGWKGRERQCGNDPHKSVLMDINNLERRSLFTKFSLEITLVEGLNGKLQLGDYLKARARTKIRKFRRDYAAKNIAFAPAILIRKIHSLNSNFLLITKVI